MSVMVVLLMAVHPALWALLLGVFLFLLLLLSSPYRYSYLCYAVLLLF